MKRGIIISIQGYQRVTTNELAGEAVKAGAVALRTDKPIKLPDGVERVPIIGLHKIRVDSPARQPYITASLEALALVRPWADLIAVDCRIVNPARRELLMWCADAQIPVVADIATLEDWKTLRELSVPYAYVATTCSVFHKNHRPDINLVKELSGLGEKNIIAEGNYSARVDVRQALKTGAHAVCLGAAVANVYKLTRKYTTIDF